MLRGKKLYKDNWSQRWGFKRRKVLSSVNRLNFFPHRQQQLHVHILTGCIGRIQECKPDIFFSLFFLPFIGLERAQKANNVSFLTHVIKSVVANRVLPGRKQTLLKLSAHITAARNNHWVLVVRRRKWRHRRQSLALESNPKFWRFGWFPGCIRSSLFNGGW